MHSYIVFPIGHCLEPEDGQNQAWSSENRTPCFCPAPWWQFIVLQLTGSNKLGGFLTAAELSPLDTPIFEMVLRYH